MLEKHKLKYTFNTIEEYLSISDNAKKSLALKPYEISYQAWEHRESNDNITHEDESAKNRKYRRTLLMF